MHENMKSCHDVINVQRFLDQWIEFCVRINTKPELTIIIKDGKCRNLELETNYPIDIPIIIIIIIISRWKREKRIKSTECRNVVRIYEFYGYEMDKMANNTLPTFFIICVSPFFFHFIHSLHSVHQTNRWTVAQVLSIHVYLVGFCLYKRRKRNNKKKGKKNSSLCCSPCSTMYNVHSILVR